MNEHEMERKITEILTDGEMKESDREQEQRKRIVPKYEIRIQTQLDPIVEETRKYRMMAQEIDDRYDRYMSRVKDRVKDRGDKEEAGE
ncbi:MULTISPECIES: hypothetical protein [unclassified Paenibacillus]|uniref:hypothetical protein n=1 Tax=unclassified Paenibacillus TaxID=185978 RepID=UPI001C1046C7|nr:MULTISPECIES: hypothetical protein [unclassified Paenibacillus]MBU5443289.1 hypothetical protein [Paenibacillus sp. MSJ-34]CAH0118850.1 hypothetical protein PAE9249_01347 [Paenibacillus sp. CECT 9249]